jgi:hypothetical protein
MLMRVQAAWALLVRFGDEVPRGARD